MTGLALVTGGSSGIGRAISDELARRGLEVITVADRPPADVIADLATGDGVRAAAAAVDGRELDVLVLNAGVALGGSFATGTPLEDDLRLLDLHVRGTVHLAKLLLEPMVRRGRGRVLITSSILAHSPAPEQLLYGASKAFLRSFARGLDGEVRSAGVTVTALLPGPTDTTIFARAGLADTPLAQGPLDNPRDVARLACDALLDGRREVVTASLLSRLAGLALARLPDRLTAPIAARTVQR